MPLVSTRLLAVALVLASAPLAATSLDAALDESQRLAAEAKASQGRVEQLDDATQVTMLESATRIEAGGRSQTLDAGQRLRFDASGPGTVEQVDSQALQNAWDDRQLLAYNQPLTDVLERLARHRKGLVLFDRQALSALRVTVMLPTDDSDRALRLLARTLPIEVRHYTPWLTRVTLLPEQKNN